LAAAWVFKRYEGDQLIQSWDVRHKHQDVVKDIRDDFSSASLYDLDQSVWGVCLCVFLLHIVIHCFVVAFLVPQLLPKEEPVSEVTYRECSKDTACNWFNSNPVHVLRSRYIHDHDPPFIFFMQGKEYVHKRNDKIHQYYEETAIQDAQEGVTEEAEKSAKDAMAYGSRVSSNLKKSISSIHLGRKRLATADTKNMDHQDDNVEGGCQIL
jgi:hypothetical protein